MSLTSYRAAPPRDHMPRLENGLTWILCKSFSRFSRGARQRLGNAQNRGEFALPVIRPQRGRKVPDLQRVFDQAVVCTGAEFQLNDLTCFKRGNRQAVAKEKAVR